MRNFPRSFSFWRIIMEGRYLASSTRMLDLSTCRPLGQYCSSRLLQNARNVEKFVPGITEVKSFAEIPRKPSLPLIGHLFAAVKYDKKAYKLLEDWHHDLGPIIFLKFAHMEMISLSDADDLEQLLRFEPKYPSRVEFEIWKHYREVSGEALGVLLAEGESWHWQRRAINPLMMKPLQVATYNPALNETATDLVKLLENVRTTDDIIPNIRDRLFMWAIESTGTVLFETRLGCLEMGGPKDKELFDFAVCVNDMFISSDRLFAFPPSVAKFLHPRLYRKHMNAWDTIFRIGKKYIDAKLNEVTSNVEDVKEKGFLFNLLTRKELSNAEVYGSMIDLMIGAVDTTTTAFQWCLYELSRHPDVQDTLYNEVARILPADATHITQEHLYDMKYLKSVIKETLRLHHPVAGVARIIPEDMVIRGYHIPKGSLVAGSTHIMAKSDKYFRDPLIFKPERWLRDHVTDDNTFHPFASLPFGFGVRSCIGRRFAELEMHLLLAHLCKRFIVKPGNATDIEISHSILMYPSKSVDVALVDRK